MVKYYFHEELKRIPSAVLVLLMIACGQQKEPDENLQQAFKIHEEAVELRNKVAVKLQELGTIEDSLFVSTQKNHLDSLTEALDNWDEQLVEVPGFEEEHDHEGHNHEGNDHHHDEQPKLTSKQHLEVQQHLFREIQAIEKSINQIEEQ